MKKTTAFLTTLLLITSNQTQCLGRVVITTLIPAAYAGYIIYQSVDLIKAERLIRQDKDYALKKTSNFIKENCKHKICKAMIQALQQAQSSKKQKAHDELQQKIDDTKTYAAAHKDDIAKMGKMFDDTMQNFKDWLTGKKK